MEKYLGVASFMYILKDLSKRYYMSNNRSVTVSAIKSGAQMFSFADYGNKGMDCGFIHTNILILRDIFNDHELDKVLNFCERKRNETTKILSHCPVASEPKYKNNIPTHTDSVDLNCLHP